MLGFSMFMEGSREMMSKEERKRLISLKKNNEKVREQIFGTAESRNGTGERKPEYRFSPIFNVDSVLKKSTGSGG